MPRLPEALQPHFDQPRNVGPPGGGHDQRGEARNQACGDHFVVYLATRGVLVHAAGFKAMGCPPFMAMASAATELLAGLDAGPGLPDALTARYELRYGPTPALHRHALRLIAEALARAEGVTPG